MHVNEVHDIDIHDSLCHFLAISPIIIEWDNLLKTCFGMWNAISSCCETKSYYSSHKSKDIST